MTNRGTSWKKFSSIVLNHIENYTVPQYGDAPDDQIEEWSADECVLTIKKRVNRFGSNARGRVEILRDLVKIAHEAQLAFDKLNPTRNEVALIEMLIRGGE